MKILNSLIESSKKFEETDNCLHIFGYFALLEKARLECLLGDFSTSLKTISSINLSDKNQRFTEVPLCHASILYHTGVCLVMMRRYSEAVEILSYIILQISKDSKTSTSSQTTSQIKKIEEKSLALATIAYVLCPSVNIHDQVLEQMDSKAPERLRKLQNGDLNTFVDIFEKVCPKFISPAVPDYKEIDTPRTNACHEAFRAQVQNLSSQLEQQLALVNLRTYLRLYSSINIEKLASLYDSTSEEFTAKLISFKHRVSGSQLTTSDDIDIIDNNQLNSKSDMKFFINEQLLNIDSSTSKQGKGREIERFFLSSVRKNSQIRSDVARVIDKYVLEK